MNDVISGNLQLLKTVEVVMFHSLQYYNNCFTSYCCSLESGLIRRTHVSLFFFLHYE